MITIYSKLAEDLRPNGGQWAAYESKGNCVILAGPGSGKTKTITLKIARLLHEDIRCPRQIACITYSNACVSELRARLDKLGVEDGRQLLLSTVHSFCLSELVLPYARLAGLNVPDPLVVVTPSDGRRLFSQAYAKVIGGQFPNWFRTACEKLRRTIPDKDSREWKAWDARQTAVVEAYEAELLNEGMIDFDGLILAGLELVEKNEWVRNAVCAKYPILVIDEYQDLGLPLHRMVLSLMQKGGVRVIAVGDPDQSIYGFTGAKPSLLRTLEGISEVEAIRLKLNYRCADQIIAASNMLLPEQGDFKSHDGRQGIIKIYQLECGIKEQALYALHTVVPSLLVQNPTWKLGDVALLYPSLNEGALIANAADELGLRYFRYDNGSPIKRSRLTDWLTLAAQWCSGGWQTGTVSLAQLLRSWRLLRRSLTRDAEILAARARLIEALFTNRNGDMSLRTWLLVLRDKVLDDMLYEEPGLSDEKDNLDALVKAASAGGTLQTFTVEIFGNQGKSPDQINFITLHSSKGLEFEVVIMLGLENGVFPSSYARTQEELEEAARLFYVGITRAKSQIHLMYERSESKLITAIREAI